MGARDPLEVEGDAERAGLASVSAVLAYDIFGTDMSGPQLENLSAASEAALRSMADLEAAPTDLRATVLRHRLQALADALAAAADSVKAEGSNTTV